MFDVRLTTRARRVILMLLAIGSPVGAQEPGRIEGRVVDAASRLPLVGSEVRLFGASGPGARPAHAREDGRFAFFDVAPGVYRLTITRLGYAQRALDSVAVNGAIRLGDVEMTVVPTSLSETVVSASRRPEKVVDAPASVFVVSQQAIAERPAASHSDHVRSVPGLDVASAGIVQANVVARGFNDLFAGDLMLLVDNRFAFVPSLRVNVPSLIAPTSDDIERIEVVLGPGAALFGPNAASGVMHLITRSPFESQGTTVTLDGGEQSLWRGAFRHAMAGRRFGFKLSGERIRARDFESVDTVEQAFIAARGGAPRDFAIDRNSLEARLDVRLDTASDIVLTASRGAIGRSLEPTGESGMVQVRDWSMQSYQLRARHNRAFGQVFFNRSSAGETFPLRSGLPVVDRSNQLVGQVQHGVSVGRHVLTYGGDAIVTTPVTEGTINGSNEDDDRVVETGAYLHSVTRLASRWDLISAARLDRHNQLSKPVFSPRIGVTYKPAAYHTLRLTYNRAFATPDNYQFFADETIQPLAPGLPYQLQLLGVPGTGFNFRRDCAGGAGSLCMRSPFLATPDVFQAASAAAAWQGAVAAIAPLLPPSAQPLVPLLQSLNPTNADVATQLAILNTGTGTFDAVSPSDVTDFERLRPTLSSVFEVGYKGAFGGRFVVAADVWRQVRKDFVFFRVLSPNVFFDAPSLQAYLEAQFAANGVPSPAATAAALAPAFAMLPLGTVQPDHPSVGPNDIGLTYRNFATVRNWGADFAAEVALSRPWTMLATYSWLDRNLFTGGELRGTDEVALNAPRHKGSLAFRARSERWALASELRGRYVDAFPAHAGLFRRDIRAYSLLDWSASWRPSPLRGFTWGVSATNLLDHRHHEFAGGAALGRLIITRLQYTL